MTGPPPPPRPVRPKKTALLVAQRILESIALQGNTVGDRLPPERVMLEQYQVGRGTLRESLRFLELQGVLTLKPGPGGGPVVSQPDAGVLAFTLSLLLQFTDAPFRAVLEARTALEPLMARLAAERITDAQLAALGENIAATRAAVGDEREFLRLVSQYHDLLAAASGNALFGYLIGALQQMLDGSAVGVHYTQSPQLATVAVHERIHAAVAARDGAAAAQRMTDHLQDYAAYVQAHYPGALSGANRWTRQD